jgi:hypothetical protein
MIFKFLQERNVFLLENFEVSFDNPTYATYYFLLPNTIGLLEIIPFPSCTVTN